MATEEIIKPEELIPEGGEVIIKEREERRNRIMGRKVDEIVSVIPKLIEGPGLVYLNSTSGNWRIGFFDGQYYLTGNINRADEKEIQEIVGKVKERTGFTLRIDYR